MEESQRRGVQVSAVHLRRPDRARSAPGIPSRRCVCGEPRFESGFGKNGLPGNDSYPTAASLSSPSSCDLGENLRLVSMSVTEGEDKPPKHPTFSMAQTLRSSPRTNLRMRWSSIGMPHGQAFKRCGPEYRFSVCRRKPAKAWKNAWSFARRNSRSRKPPSILTKAMERKTATL